MLLPEFDSLGGSSSGFGATTTAEETIGASTAAVLQDGPSAIASRKAITIGKQIKSQLYSYRLTDFLALLLKQGGPRKRPWRRLKQKPGERDVETRPLSRSYPKSRWKAQGSAEIQNQHHAKEWHSGLHRYLVSLGALLGHLLPSTRPTQSVKAPIPHFCHLDA